MVCGLRGSPQDERLDVVGSDDHGSERVLIEVKFWAGLTDHQPTPLPTNPAQPRQAARVGVGTGRWESDPAHGLNRGDPLRPQTKCYGFRGIRRGRSWPWGGGVGLVKSYRP